MRYQLTGACDCQKIHLKLELSGSPETYNPRACDCAFCRQHGASYVSDPHGSLHFYVDDAHALERYRQGSGMAEFLVCKTCAVLVGATYLNQGKLYATVNSRVIKHDHGVTFAAPVAVSPSQLSDGDKAARWMNLWFRDVSIAPNLFE